MKESIVSWPAEREAARKKGFCKKLTWRLVILFPEENGF